MASASEQFLHGLAATKLSALERAVALLWWYSRSDPTVGRTAAQLAREIEAAGYGVQNPTRLRDALSSDRRTTRSKDGSFRLRIDARVSLDEQFSRSSRAVTPAGPAAEAELTAAGGSRSHPASGGTGTKRPRSKTAKKSSGSGGGRAVATLRPQVFIGSSKEGLPEAEALQENLDHVAESTVWSQGVFGLSGGTLETLVSVAGTFDFAVLVLSPDDLTNKRGSKKQAPRDNVLFELGLFMGVLGRTRTFVVHPRNVDMHLPSDLAGITPATYDRTRRDQNLTAALGAVSTQLRRAFALEGIRQR